MFTGIHSQNVHWHSLSKCSLAFTATSPFAQGEQTYLRIASHQAPPSLLHIHPINNILRLPHLASYFYILKYLLLYAIYRILYIITLAQLSSIRSQIARHIRLDSLQSLVPLITPHQALVLFSSHKELSVLPASVPRLITSAFRLQANRQSISQLVHGC